MTNDKGSEMQNPVKMNNIPRIVFLGSVILFCTMGITPSALAKCTISKTANPIQRVTTISNKIAELAKIIDSVRSGEKAIPSMVECSKELDKLSATLDKDMKNWLKGIDKSDKKAKQDVVEQIFVMTNSMRTMEGEMALAEKRVPALKIKNRIAPNVK